MSLSGPSTNAGSGDGDSVTSDATSTSSTAITTTASAAASSAAPCSSGAVAEPERRRIRRNSIVRGQIDVMSEEVQERFKAAFTAFDTLQCVPIPERASVGSSKKSKKRLQKQRSKTKAGKAPPVKIDEQTYMPLSKVLQLQKHFVLRVNDFLAIISLCPPLTSSSPWMDVFYHRMFVFENIVTTAMVQHYEQVIGDYLFLLEDTIATKPGRVRAQSLLRYLNTHHTDPCCSLLGMHPSADVDRFFRRFLANRKRTTPAPPWPEYLPRDAQHEPDAALASVRSSSMFFPMGKQEYHVGSLILCVRPCNGESVYAIVKETSSDTLVIYTTRSTTQCETVTVDNVTNLTSGLAEMVNDKRTAQKMVQDPVAAYFHHILMNTRTAVDHFLEIQGIDFKIIDHCNLNQASIKMLLTVQRFKDILTRFKSSPPTELLDRLQRDLEESETQFLETLDVSTLYVPAIRSLDQELAQFDVERLAMSKIQQYLGVCESALLQLNIQIRDLLNGATKRQLSNWWLVHIETSSREFLESLGYNSAAVPEHYTLVPPHDYMGILDNLKLVREVLDKKHDMHNVTAFVDRLKQEIYPRIDEFVEQGKIVLANQFELNRDQPLDLVHVNEMLAQSREKLDEMLASWIDGMVKDIQYLEAMKVLEDANRTGRLELTNVVPISGLIFSYFYRAENELKTILELWPPPTSPLSSPLNSPLSSPPLSPRSRPTPPRSTSPAPPARLSVSSKRSSKRTHLSHPRLDVSSKKPPPPPPALEPSFDDAHSLDSQSTESDSDGYDKFMSLLSDASRRPLPGEEDHHGSHRTERDADSRSSRAKSPLGGGRTRSPEPAVELARAQQQDLRNTGNQALNPDGSVMKIGQPKPRAVSRVSLLVGKRRGVSPQAHSAAAAEAGSASLSCSPPSVVFPAPASFPSSAPSLSRPVRAATFSPSTSTATSPASVSSPLIFTSSPDSAASPSCSSPPTASSASPPSDQLTPASTSSPPPGSSSPVFSDTQVPPGLQVRVPTRLSVPAGMPGHSPVHTVRYQNGDVYVGEVKQRQRHGYGTYTYANGDQYEGNSFYGAFSGRGRFTFGNGDVYMGTFKNNKFHGRGVLQSSNFQFFGHFANDQLSGFGVCHFANGERFSGFFLENERHGAGTYVYKDGVQFRGVYENDVPILRFGCDSVPPQQRMTAPDRRS